MSSRVHCDSYPCKNVKPVQNAVWVRVDLQLFDKPNTYLDSQPQSADCCSWACVARLVKEQMDSSPACRAHQHRSCSPSDVCTCSCHVDYHCHREDEHEQCSGTVQHDEEGDRVPSGGPCRCYCHEMDAAALP